MSEVVKLENSEQVLMVHDEGTCRGETCSVHRRSNHSMRDMPQLWRADRGIMERVCEHGIGHPDPDDYRVNLGLDDGVHGCDGCCTKEQSVPKKKELITVEDVVDRLDSYLNVRRDADVRVERRMEKREALIEGLAALIKGAK